MKVKCDRVLVLVTRDMTETIPATVFIHEVPILQAIHGDDSVNIAPNPEKIMAGTTEALILPGEREKQIERMLSSEEIDSGEEYQRLVQRYGLHSDVPIPYVEYVHGRINSKQWIDAMRMKASDIGASVDDEENYSEEEAAPAPRRGRPPKSAESNVSL